MHLLYICWPDIQFWRPVLAENNELGDYTLAGPCPLRISSPVALFARSPSRSWLRGVRWSSVPRAASCYHTLPQRDVLLHSLSLHARSRRPAFSSSETSVTPPRPSSPVTWPPTQRLARSATCPRYASCASSLAPLISLLPLVTLTLPCCAPLPAHPLIRSPCLPTPAPFPSAPAIPPRPARPRDCAVRPASRLSQHQLLRPRPRDHPRRHTSPMIPSHRTSCRQPLPRWLASAFGGVSLQRVVIQRFIFCRRTPRHPRPRLLRERLPRAESRARAQPVRVCYFENSATLHPLHHHHHAQQTRARASLLTRNLLRIREKPPPL
ncbi:hypothetical protein OH77DRAFT_334626 [Trametes cingulata]|nr:hypothetical protein OH77DRAFT_334626 [Trametes cingulata]